MVDAPFQKIDEGANWLGDVVPSSEAPGPDPMSFETKSACPRTHSRRNIAISEDVVCVGQWSTNAAFVGLVDEAFDKGEIPVEPIKPAEDFDIVEE